MIRIGILGYDNLGRGVEYAVEANEDMELVAVFTRRDQSTWTLVSFHRRVSASSKLPRSASGVTVSFVKSISVSCGTSTS